LALLAGVINDSVLERDRVVVVATHSSRLVSLLDRCVTVDLTP
jgi:ABC-type lipoprotein export system ATPase subunit